MLKNQEYLDFIRYSIGSLDFVPQSFVRIDWEFFFQFCHNQSILGVVFSGLERANKRIPQNLLFEWIGAVENLKAQNNIVNKRVISVTKWFEEKKHHSVILKGQANALMYPKPELRSPGDIDIWVEGEAVDIIKTVHKVSPESHYSIHHVKLPVFEDVSVEVHYRPVYLPNWFNDKKLQRYICNKEEAQFSHHEIIGGASVGTLHDDFNLIFQMLHMYNHFFSSRNNLKQLIDYYYLLKKWHNNPTKETERKEIVDLLKDLGVLKYAKGVMWVLQNVLCLDTEQLLVESNERIGRIVLREMMNYGKKTEMSNMSLVWHQLTSNLRLVSSFPIEVLINPLFLVWHQWWKAKMWFKLKL